MRLEDLFHLKFNGFNTPMVENCQLAINGTPLCLPTVAAKFRSIIDSANWLITLGRFGINYATMPFEGFNMAPRKGHLKVAMRIL